MKSGVVKNIAYNMAYQILLILVPLVTTPYLSRVLGKENLGIFSFHNTIAYYFSIFIMLGLNNYGNRKIASVRDDKEQTAKEFTSIYIMQLSLGTIVCLFYLLYVLFFSRDRGISAIFYVYLFSEVIDINWFFNGMERFDISVLRSFIVKLMSTLGIFIFIKDQSHIRIYCAIIVGSALLNQLILWWYVPKLTYIKRVCIKDVLAHIKPNLILFLSVLGTSLYKYMDKLMLGEMANMSELGLYEQAEKIIALPVALVVALGNVMLPRMTYLKKQNNNDDKFFSYFTKSVVFAVFIASSTAFGIMGVAREFVPIFYGDGYEKIVALFYVLLPACIFLGVGNVITTQYLIPSNKDSIYIKSIFLGALVNIFINAILIPKYYAIGAAIGTLLAEAVVCSYKILKSQNDMRTIQSLRVAIPFVLFGIGMFLVLHYLNTYLNGDVFSMVIKILAGSIIYLLFAIPYVKFAILKTEREKCIRKE